LIVGSLLDLRRVGIFHLLKNVGQKCGRTLTGFVYILSNLTAECMSSYGTQWALMREEMSCKTNPELNNPKKLALCVDSISFNRF